MPANLTGDFDERCDRDFAADRRAPVITSRVAAEGGRVSPAPAPVAGEQCAAAGRGRAGPASQRLEGEEQEEGVGENAGGRAGPALEEAEVQQQRDAQVETVVAGHVVVWTDGASSNNQYPELRRAGCGAFWGIGHSYNVSEALHGAHQGEEGNNRAELQAVLCVLRREKHRAVEIRTDSNYVWNGCMIYRAR
eukprot:gene3985-4953_t